MSQLCGVVKVTKCCTVLLLEIAEMSQSCRAVKVTKNLTLRLYLSDKTL